MQTFKACSQTKLQKNLFDSFVSPTRLALLWRLRVAQNIGWAAAPAHLVGHGDLLELLARVGVLVRVVLQRQLPVGLLQGDLVGRGGDPEQVIELGLLNHRDVWFLTETQKRKHVF